MKLDVKPFQEKMQKTVDAYSNDLASIRAGRASAEVLNKISFLYWGAPTPINTMASISVADARTLVVTPYDKTTLKEMDKAIQTSDLGIHPQNDGSCLRLVFPPMTEDRRKELTKTISQKGEAAKIAIRNIRRDANEETKLLKKDGLITEDEIKASDKEVQDLTDKFTKKIDEITAIKDKEILTI